MKPRTTSDLRAALVRPLAAFLVAIGCFVGGALLVPHAFLPVRTLLYRELDGVVVLAVWALGLGALLIATRPLRAATDARTLVAAQLGIGAAIAMVTPVLASTDAIAYVYYGALALAGANPWHPPPPALAPVAPALADAMRQIFGEVTPGSIYGPAFVALEAALVAALHAAPLSVVVFAQRALALGAFAAITPLLPPDRRARWALDPLVLFVCAVDGHNDALFLLPVAAALTFHTRGVAGIVLAGLGFALGGAIKIVALAAGLLRPRALFVALALLAVWVTAMPFAWTLAPQTAQGSLAHAAQLVLFDVPRSALAVIAVRVTLFAIAVGVALRLVRSRDDVAVVATLALVLAIPVVQPWYAVWIAFMCAREHVSPVLSRYVAVLEGLAFVIYIPSVF